MNASGTYGDPLWQRSPAAYRALFRPLDLEIRVSATHSRLIDLAACVLGEQHEPAAGPSRRFQPGPSAEDAPRGTDLPRPAMDLVLVAGTDVGGTQTPGAAIHRERGGLYAASVAGVGITTADLALGRAAVFVELDCLESVERSAGVSSASGALQAAEVLIGSPVWRFAASHGLVALHAGAVTGPLGTILVRGPAGSGKSTTVLAAGLAGWWVVADEVVWYDPLVDPPLLRGTGSAIRIESADGAKSAVLPGEAGGIRSSDAAPIGCLVCLAERDQAAGSWRPLRPDEARTAFESGAHPGENTQDGPRLGRARAALLSGSCFELKAGPPETVADQLAAIAAHARQAAPTAG